jgi:hypothetical protein
LPIAKLGQNNFIYVSSHNGVNYFNLGAINPPAIGYYGGIENASIQALTNALTVQQAYAIDSKIDDGLPQTGTVKAGYAYDGNYYWWAGSFEQWYGGINFPDGVNTSAWAGSSTSCFDNGNVGGMTHHYSITQNGGAGLNCALTFRMQAGD